MFLFALLDCAGAGGIEETLSRDFLEAFVFQNGRLEIENNFKTEDKYFYSQFLLIFLEILKRTLHTF